MIYHVPDDPELGYFTDDDVEPCDKGHGMKLVDSFTHVEEAHCSLCRGELPQDATVPLCATCVLTCRAHARQEQAHREWVADGSPR